MSDLRNNEGSPFDEDDDGGIAHGTGEGWGSPEDLAAVIEHVQSTPPGMEPWGLDEGSMMLPRAANREGDKSPEQTRHEVGQFHAPENHPAESWQDCPQCSWYGLGDAHNWKPDEEQDPFDPRLIGASRDPLLAGVADVLNYSDSLIKEAIPEHLRGKTYEESPEWADQVWRHVMRNPDGMTFKDNPGDGPTTGQMVSYPKDEVEGVIPFHMLLPEDLHQHFVTDHGDRINSRPDNMAGGWTSGPPEFDPNNPEDVERWGDQGPGPGPHYYVDVSRNEDDPHEMVGEALAHGQDGLYDLNPGGKGYLPTTEGLGELYPEQPHRFWTGKRK